MRDEETRRRERMEKRKKKRRSRMFSVLIVACLFTVLSVQIVKAHKKYRSVVAEEKELEQQKADEEEKAKDLEKEKAYRASQEYIEDTAQSRLGMVHDNQIIFRENKD